MEFILRILVDMLQPTAQLILLGLTSGWLFWKKNTRWARRISMVTIVLLVIYSTPFIPKLLARTLERQYPVWTYKADTYPEGIPIMVLGSGAMADTTLHPSHQLSNKLHARLMEGIRIIGCQLSAISFCSGRNAGGCCIYLRVDQGAYWAGVVNLSRLSIILAVADVDYLSSFLTIMEFNSKIVNL